MSTIRAIIAAKSTAAAGSTIRQHFAAPYPGGVIYSGTIRDIILHKSSAITGSTIRQHFASPYPGSGGNSTNPGEENVLFGIMYMINGVQYVGKRKFPPIIIPLSKLTLYQVSDAVANILRAATLPIDVEVNRSWNPQVKISDLRTRPIVYVVPKSQDEKWESRSLRIKTFNIDIGIQKKIEASNKQEIDLIVSMSNIIEQMFTPDCLDWYLPGTICLGASNDPVVSVEHLDQHLVCTSLLSVKFMES